MTRKSGFNASAAVRLRQEQVESVHLRKGEVLTVEFVILDVRPGLRIGFGGWFAGAGLDVTVHVSAEIDLVVSDGEPPVWRKFGGQWVADGSGDFDVEVEFLAINAITDVALYGLDAGHVFHEAFDATRPALLMNNWSIAPEGNFYVPETGTVEVFTPKQGAHGGFDSSRRVANPMAGSRTWPGAATQAGLLGSRTWSSCSGDSTRFSVSSPGTR